MSAFSPENTAKAIQRVPSTASKDLEKILPRAKANGSKVLVTAIEQELSLRGPMNLSVSDAQQHAEWAERVKNLDLTDAIAMAFQISPINADERVLTREIARNPGISHQDLTKFRGKGDVALILGHMVYERLGFFRKFLDGTERMSDLLFLREKVSGRITYRLTVDAERAFSLLQIV